MTLTVLRSASWMLVLFIVSAAVSAAHLWQLHDTPQGFFQDESAIALNAALIEKTGKDEHGHVLPLYFESFGDYKAPIDTYAVALVFAVTGPSYTALRFTSALFFFGMLAAMMVFAKEYAPRSKATIVYTLMAAGFLPWIFTFSRIGFEVASQAATLMLGLLSLFLTMRGGTVRQQWVYSICCGLCFALCLYAYPTSRLLVPLFALTAALFFFRSSTVRQSLIITISFLIGCIPYLLYTIFNPDAMVARFKGITYVFDPSLGLWEKTLIFFGNYITYFSPEYLLGGGDGNLRHATGFGGELTFGVFGLCLVGIVSVFSGKKQHTRFGLYLIAGLLLAPVAASLTQDGTPHAIRSLTMAVFILLLSIIGFVRLQESAGRWPSVFAAFFLSLLVVESGFYINDYFHHYKGISVGAFESAGLEESISIARAQHPQIIVISDALSYVYADFENVRNSPENGTTVTSAKARPVAGTCVIYPASEAWMVESGNLQAIDLSLPDAFVRLRCFPRQ